MCLGFFLYHNSQNKYSFVIKQYTINAKSSLFARVSLFIKWYKCYLLLHLDNVKKYLDFPLSYGPQIKFVTPKEVKNTILKYPNKKSPGFDLITAEVTKYLPTKAIVLLTYIISAILRLSYFTTLWKFSQIIMFTKSNKPPDSPDSYRPISLLPFFSKICERLIP